MEYQRHAYLAFRLKNRLTSSFQAGPRDPKAERATNEGMSVSEAAIRNDGEWIKHQ